MFENFHDGVFGRGVGREMDYYKRNQSVEIQGENITKSKLETCRDKYKITILKTEVAL